MSFVQRLKEGSSWAGIAALLNVVAAILPQYSVYLLALAGGAAGVAVKLPDTGAKLPDAGIK